MAATASLTHIALRAQDLDASIDFYHRYAGLVVVHDRVDADTRVVWLAEVEEDPPFVIVLMDMRAEPSGHSMSDHCHRASQSVAGGAHPIDQSHHRDLEIAIDGA